jgi:hypothetical protein
MTLGWTWQVRGAAPRMVQSGMASVGGVPRLCILRTLFETPLSFKGRVEIPFEF